MNFLKQLAEQAEYIAAELRKIANSGEATSEAMQHLKNEADGLVRELDDAWEEVYQQEIDPR